MNATTPKPRPQDDLFAFVNQDWIASTDIPDEQQSWGIIHEMRERVEAQQYELLTALEAQGDADDQERLRQIFLSHQNRDANAENALTLFRELLSDAKAIEDESDFYRLLGRFSRFGVGSPIQISISSDLETPDRNTIYISQSGLTLPDRDYYLDDSERFETARHTLVGYAAKLVSRLGEHSRSYFHGMNVLAIETAIAGIQSPSRELRNVEKVFNPMSLSELKMLNPSIAWQDFLQAFGLNTLKIDRVIVMQPDYFRGFSKIFDDLVRRETVDSGMSEDDIAQMAPMIRLVYLRAYLLHRLAHWAAGFLMTDLERVRYDSFEKPISGTQSPPPEWKKSVRFVNEMMGWAISKQYCDAHFPDHAMDAMDKLIGNLKSAYLSSVESLDWLSAEAKETAKQKLRSMGQKVGRPARWRDYEGLYVSSDNVCANVIAARSFETDYQIAKLDKPTDKDQWHMTAHTVNAYYSPLQNEIVFPAGFLQPPLFDPDQDLAYNYGAIGAVIGHEMSHGFDDQGRKFGPDGALQDWWSDQDSAAFEAASKKLIDQYAAFEPVPGIRLDGELTLGENIADLTGLTLAYRAYQRACADETPETLDGLTGDQRFFVGWARAWRWKYRDEALVMMAKSGPHSPAEYRVNGIVSNMPEFAEAFDLTASDKLFRAPETRVAIW